MVAKQGGIPSLAGTEVSAFEAYIQDKSYVLGGPDATPEDMKAFAQLAGRIPDKNKFPCTARWASHIAAYQRTNPLKFQLGNNLPSAEQNKNNMKKGQAGAASGGNNTNKGEDVANIEGKLPGAEMGKVCTRFPPEPSGYMHIGHAKAALLNNAYARMYDGKIIVRFDDTNPSKEKQEFEDTILYDAKSLGIKPDRVTHTSDYFDLLQKEMETLIKKGDAYVDDTPVDDMRAERDAGTESKCRSQTVEENMRRWQEMLKGSEEGLKNCVRGKMNMQDPVKCLRDPVFYRCKTDTPHHKLGTKYKAYPTYDWACPIVDAHEGVTHSLRTIEYKDRDAMYKWVQDKVGKGKSHLYEFSKTQFTYTVLSKRKLTWFVDNGHVTGWDDPRMPTVKGILRRGMTVQALNDFMKTQGASKRDVLMEWDKIWALNRQIIDPTSDRYTAVTNSSEMPAVPVFITDTAPITPFCSMGQRHPKFPEKGKKVIWHADTVYLEQADADLIENGEEITLMKWGNVICEKIEKDKSGKIVKINAKLNLSGDIKSTKKKLHWVAKTDIGTPLILREFDHLVTKAKFDEDDNFQDFINEKSIYDTPALGEPALKNLRKGDIVQLERIGFFYVDRVNFPFTEPIILHKIPDGKQSAMTKNIKGAVDPSKIQGANKNKESAKTGAAGAAAAAAPAPGTLIKGTPEDHAALAAAKSKVAALKEAGAGKEEVTAAVEEMKRLKDVCGEVELSKSERKKLEKAGASAGKTAPPPAAPAPAAAPAPGTLTKGTPEDHAALAAAKAKVTALKEKGASKEEIGAAVDEMKRLKEVCGEVELSKSERKKLDKAAKNK